MTHLRPSEFVDGVDGTLAPDRARHVEGCGACAAQVATLRETMEAARLDDAEPSPLFWNHFPARVRAALDTEPVVARSWRRPLAALGWTAAAVALSAIALRAPQPATVAPERSSGSAPTIASPVGRAQQAAEQNEEPWETLAKAAAGVQLEDAHAVGFAVPAAALETAVLDLTPAEQEELGRLLREELKGSGI